MDLAVIDFLTHSSDVDLEQLLNGYPLLTTRAECLSFIAIQCSTLQNLFPEYTKFIDGSFFKRIKSESVNHFERSLLSKDDRF